MIGAVRCRGMRLCEPCTVVQRYAGRPVLRELVHRGGLRADILSAGAINVGDEIRATPAAGCRTLHNEGSPASAGRSLLASTTAVELRPRGSSLGSRRERFGSAIASRIVRGPFRRQGVMQFHAVLRRSRRVQRRGRSPRHPGRHTSRSPSSSWSSPTSSPAATCSPARPPARARRSPSASRSSTGSQSDGPRPAALILAPTRELATQIAADIRGHRPRPRAARHRRLRRRRPRQAGQAAPRAAHIIVATPGRLEDLPRRGGPSTCATIQHARPRRGRPDARHGLPPGRRPDRRRLPGAAPDAVLLGHAGRRGRRITAQRTPTTRSATSTARPRAAPPRTSSTGSSPSTASGRIEALITELAAERDLALVFVRTKRGADRLVKRLGARGLDAVAMHGNKSQRQRECALARFESGQVDTLVATDVAARGIDVTGISHVINFDPPADHETYVHRVGRTGRAGRTGVGITLVDRSERRDVGRLADRLGIEHGLGSSSGSPSGPVPVARSRPGRPKSGTPAANGHRPPRQSAGSGHRWPAAAATVRGAAADGPHRALSVRDPDLPGRPRRRRAPQARPLRRSPAGPARRALRVRGGPRSRPPASSRRGSCRVLAGSRDCARTGDGRRRRPAGGSGARPRTDGRSATARSRPARPRRPSAQSAPEPRR